MHLRYLLVLVGAVALAIGVGACGVSSPITVDVTITQSVGALSASPDTSLIGYVQGYVFTPTGASASTRQSSGPVVSQSPEPEEGYAVPTTSVVVSIPGVDGATTRPDINGFFAFAGYPVDAPPVQVLVEFPGGGFQDFLADVPIVPREFGGMDVAMVDLDDNTTYTNNAQDIRSIASCKLNFDVSASQAARVRLFVSGRGDLTRAEVLESEEAHPLVEYDLQTGQSRELTNIAPLNGDQLCRLATPADGNHMFFLYLITEDKTDTSLGASAAITSLEMIFRARVSAPL